MSIIRRDKCRVKSPDNFGFAFKGDLEDGQDTVMITHDNDKIRQHLKREVNIIDDNATIPISPFLPGEKVYLNLSTVSGIEKYNNIEHTQGYIVSINDNINDFFPDKGYNLDFNVQVYFTNGKVCRRIPIFDLIRARESANITIYNFPSMPPKIVFHNKKLSYLGEYDKIKDLIVFKSTEPSSIIEWKSMDRARVQAHLE